MSKTGRNDPCWCGSGTKYKKCHLESDEAEARKDRDLQKEAEALRDPVAEKLAGEILDGTERWQTREDFDRAREIYFDADPREVTPDPQDEDAFVDWYMRDFRPASTGRTAIEKYLLEAGPRLSPSERALVEAWRNGTFSLYEVTAVEFGVSIQLKDLVDGTEYTITDPLIAKQVHLWDCMLTRVDHYGDQWRLGGDTATLPRVVARQILKNAGPSPNLRARSHELHRQIEEYAGEWAGDVEVAEMDDETGEIVSVQLPCVDAEAARVEFRKLAELVEFPLGFTWRTANRKPLGTILFHDGTIELKSDSPTRLEIFKEFIEYLLPAG